MRPTPSESLQGLRQILERVISPELQSDYARIRFGEVVLALRGLESTVESDYVALAREHRTLSDLAKRAHQLLVDSPPSTESPELRLVAAQLDDELAHQSPAFREGLPAFAALNEACGRLNELLSRMMALLDRPRHGAATSPGPAQLHELVRAHVRADLAGAPAPTSRRMGVIGGSTQASSQ